MNLAIYGRAVLHLARHPSVIVVPLLASVIDMLATYWGGVATDPLGGYGTGLVQMAVQIVYLFSFGAAIVQANNIERGHRAGFDDAWEETRKKTGGIILAAIGFQFVVFVAQYIGQIFSIGAIGYVLQLIAYFFLIFTIPAAAIGGLPSSLALSGSIRAVRANPLAAFTVAVAFIVLWVFVPIYVQLGISYAVMGHLSGLTALAVIMIGQAVYRAIVLAYLAFPFAVTYDDVAFKLW